MHIRSIADVIDLVVWPVERIVYYVPSYLYYASEFRKLSSGSGGQAAVSGQAALLT